MPCADKGFEVAANAIGSKVSVLGTRSKTKREIRPGGTRLE